MLMKKNLKSTFRWKHSGKKKTNSGIKSQKAEECGSKPTDLALQHCHPHPNILHPSQPNTLPEFGVKLA